MKQFLFIFFTALLLIRRSFSYSRCNHRLLNNFQLKGLQIAISDGMHICPAVRTRCCSLMDEIRILQYWRQVTHPKLIDFSDTIMRYYGVFLEFFEYFTEVDRSEIVFHYLYFAQIEYQDHYCLESNTIVEETPDDAERNVQRLVPGQPGQEIYKLTPDKPMVITDVETRQLYDYFREDVATISQYLQELGQKIVAGKRLKDSQRLKSQREEVSKVILQKSFEVQKKLAHELKEKAEKSNIFAKVGLKKPNIVLPSIQPPVIPDDIKFAVMTEEDKKMKEEFDALGIKVPHYLYNMITIRRYMEKQNKNSKLLKDPFFPDITKAFKGGSLGPENPKKVPEIPFQERSIPKIECSKQTKQFIRPFVIANYDKLKYCHNLMDEFFEFDAQSYLEIQTELKTDLNRTLDLKKNFYCDLCDFNKQQFFDFHNNKMIFDRGFCKNLLVSNKAYIEFNNVTFIKYLDQMLQLKQCFEHGGNSYQMPFVTMLHHLVRKIPFFEECFEHLDKKDYYRYCRFICMDYKYHNFSDIIEGHIHLYNRAYTAILSFLTKYTDADHLTLATIKRQKMKTHIQKIEDIIEASKFKSKEKVNEDVKKLNDLIEETEYNIKKIPQKIQTDFYDMSITNESLKQYIEEEFEAFEPLTIFEKQQLEVEGDADTYGFQEHRISPEFYLKAKQPVKIDDMEPFFAKHQDAINPYEESNLVNFRYNITNLIKDQMSKITVPKIQPNVIKNYLQITEKNLKDFEQDVYFRVDKTISKKRSHVIPRFKPKKVKYRKYRKPRNRSLDWLQPYLEPNNKDDRENLMDQLLHKLPKY